MPSRCTVHAPQRATPQPNLVPFMPRRSRKTHSNGMSGEASTVWDMPLICNVTMINLPIHPRNGRYRPVRCRTKSTKGQRCASQQNSCVNDSYGVKLGPAQCRVSMSEFPERGRSGSLFDDLVGAGKKRSIRRCLVGRTIRDHVYFSVLWIG